ncbi:MAG: hypothetical protein GX620_13295 [Chloroflexi bacterium]|nr:hypothetical protein [Chloroflexota bacterium]
MHLSAVTDNWLLAVVNVLGRLILLVGVLFGALQGISSQAMAQTGGWSDPVLLSTNTANSWWSDVAVDGTGRAHVVWMSGRSGYLGEDALDLLMYSGWDGQAWSDPNDIIVTARGGYTIRPAIAADANDFLHITYRGGTQIFHANALVSSAWNAASWADFHLMSGTGAGYYSDVAVDSKGAIHVVWNESVSDNPDERAVWIGTSGGISVYDGWTWQSHGAKAGPGSEQIHSVFEDRDGVQWIGTANGALSFDGAVWKPYSIEDGLPDSDVYAIAQDGDGAMWFGTGNGLARRDASLSAVLWSTYSAEDGLAGNRVTAIGVYEGRVLWFGTDGGLSRYDGRTWVGYTTAQGLADNVVTALAVDVDGTVWAGTPSGLSRYDGKGWTTYTVADGLADNYVTALALDRMGGLWIGTRAGISHYDSRRWLKYTQEDGLIDNSITALAVDSTGALWVGTDRGVSQYDGGVWRSFMGRDGLVDDQVTAIGEDAVLNAVCPFCADIYYRNSTDGGRTWSPPVNLSQSYAGSVKPQVRIDHRDGIHVVWEEGEDWYAAAGYPIGSVHMYSPDGGQTWPRSTVFSTDGDAPQQITLGIGREDELIVIWRLTTANELFYQRSVDNGLSWSVSAPINGVEAKTWLPMSLDSCDAATDSSGNVHVLVLGRLSPSEEDLSVLHLEWSGEQWLPAEKVFTSADPPEWPRIAIGRGNRVFATWFTRDREHIWDSAQGRYQVWSAYHQSDAPEQTPVPYPTASPSPAPTLTPQPVLATTVTPSPVLPPGTSGLPVRLDTEDDDLVLLAIALSPVVTLVLAVAVFRLGWLERTARWVRARFR